MSKSNDPESTLRKGDLPRVEKAKDAKVDNDKAVACARKQNTSDGNDDALVVIPRTGIANPPHTGGFSEK